ncbi:MAG TPA: SLBB domain-containing protein, partial [Bacteroidota bacterium]|nr:SLBB domain-containing protein [Bacteroidota bacterium]
CASWAFLGAMVGLCCTPAAGQQAGTSDLGSDWLSALGRGAATQAVQPTVTTRSVALESTVDPDEYIVGPSDGFGVTIWTSPPIVANTAVTPEGTLIIPSVGEIRVADLSLTKARAVILDEIRRRFISAKATVTLTSPRTVIVTVLGHVLVPGTYVLSTTDRVSRAIEAANQVARSQKVEEELNLQYMRTLQSKRLIVVHHRNGTDQAVDLSRYAAENLDTLNPYLQGGDVIVVPRVNEHRGLIGVYGAVHLPGRLEYVPGDSIHTAIDLAYGCTEEAKTDSIELYRYDRSGRETQRTIINVNQTGSDMPLHAGDRIVVRRKPDLRGDPRVVVNGEVRFPGTYPISREGTKLSQIIAMAGGFTSQAALSSATVVRQAVNPTEIEAEKLASYTGGVPPEDTLYYAVETASRIQGERVSTDFVALFQQGDSTRDVTMKDGDVITIPAVDLSIYVFGQVVLPGHVPFEAGRDYEYYIRQAGGLTDRARTGGIRVVKASTKQWLDPSDTKVEEGDYIWVPMVTEHNFAYYVTVISQAAGIIGVAVSLAVLVVQLKK